jgi:outer membrane protein TolC
LSCACICFLSLRASSQTYTLAYYLQKAKTQSPLLNDYRNRMLTGGIDSLVIRAAQRPQVLANGQIMYAPIINGYGYDEAITNGANYMAVVAVSQPLFNKGILQPRYQSVRLQDQVIRNTAKTGELDLEKNITAQYITSYADYRQLLSNREVYELLQTQQALLKPLVQQGIYTQTDYLNFQVALQSEEIALNQLQMQYKMDISTLNYLCGINDTTTVLLEPPQIPALTFPGKANSIFFRKFAIDSLKILNSRALTDMKYKASLSWFADAGLQSSMLDNLYKNFGVSFGLNFNVPIYDGRQRKLEYRRLKIEEDTRSSYASFFDRQYNQQVAMLRQQLDAMDALIKNIREKLEASRTLIELSKKQLNTGDLRITDYILAVNNYLNVRSSLNQAVINRYQVINQLNYWKH